MNSLLDIISGSSLEWKLTIWEAAVLEAGGLLSGELNKDTVSCVIRFEELLSIGQMTCTYVKLTLSALGVVRLLIILPRESTDIWASSFLHLDSS